MRLKIKLWTRLAIFLLVSTPTNCNNNVKNHRKNEVDESCATGAKCSCFQGPPGAPGIPGIPGIHGDRGVDGKDGLQGMKGDTGPPGPRGPTGPAGRDGRDGSSGKRGSLGRPGEPGIPGKPGRDGKDGTKGDKGESVNHPPNVAFSVARRGKLGPVYTHTTVTFDKVFTNDGDMFDVYSSHFVCKLNGTYIFLAHILGQANKDAYAWIMLNDKHQVPMHGDGRAGYGTGSNTIILKLKVDDHVWIQLNKDSAVLNDYTTFSGYLLYAD